jgi:GNAT superfamily N-acetyltransferase
LVEPLSNDNIDEVLQLLGEDPYANIILIADSTQLVEWCDVRIYREDGVIKSIFSLYKDLDFLAGAFWTTSEEAVRVLMQDMDVFGKKLVFIATGEQLEILSKIATDVKPRKERQMVIDSKSEVVSWGSGVPERLSSKAADELREFYKCCGVPAWTPTALELGPFYAVREGEEVVSVAGVHFVTPFTAELGNVATHPDYRGKGYASKCVAAVTDELLETTPSVILHFFEDNTSAQKLYEKMGFRYTHVDPLFFVEAQL